MSLNILVIANALPEPDQASGDLRFSTILEMLCQLGRVNFVLRDITKWRATHRAPQRYEKMLADIGVQLLENSVYTALSTSQYDVVWFEFYFPAREFGLLVRHLQPNARVVVDSVDVHFNRLAAKARLTGKEEDLAEATETRIQELTAYRDADMVAAVSEDDRQVILDELPDQHTAILPNVHKGVSFPPDAEREHGHLVFVGSFRHTPNIDAMLYFVGEVMPLIRERISGVRLSIIGSSPPPEIKALASDDIDVIGYVEETAPYLLRAHISIAPLRYGGGLKGKVGEALSYGLPVVTTSFGAEGFGLTPGRELLVANSSEEFAEAIIQILKDEALCERLGKAGYQFIMENYSPDTMRDRLNRFVADIMRIQPIRLSLAKRLMRSARGLYDRHFGWRFHRP